MCILRKTGKLSIRHGMKCAVSYFKRKIMLKNKI